MLYVYSIFEVNFIIDIPFAVYIQSESAPFIHELKSNEKIADAIYIKLTPADSIIPIPKNAYSIENRIYFESNRENLVWFSALPNYPPYLVLRYCWDNPQSAQITYLHNKQSEISYSHNLIELIGLETILCLKKGLLLHSSFINFNGKGLLFSAPSGTGKSTQADLWAKYLGADIINGDRAGIRKIDGKWMCFGLPYAGTSGIYRDEKAELTALFILEQGKENVITRLKPIEAFIKMYSETMIHRWDKRFTEKITNTLKEFTEQIPTFMLTCLPNQEAVLLALDAINNL